MRKLAFTGGRSTRRANKGLLSSLELTTDALPFRPHMGRSLSLDAASFLLVFTAPFLARIVLRVEGWSTTIDQYCPNGGQPRSAWAEQLPLLMRSRNDSRCAVLEISC